MATETASITDKGTKGFLKWLAISQPAIYKKIEPKLASIISQAKVARLAGLGDASTSAIDATFMTPVSMPDSSSIQMSPVNVVDAASTSSTSSTLADTLKSLVGAASAALLTKQQLDTQSKITDIQLQRAQRGLSPLNTDQLGLPGLGVNVGLSSGTQSMVLWGIGILGAVFLLPKLLGGRK